MKFAISYQIEQETYRGDRAVGAASHCLHTILEIGMGRDFDYIHDQYLSQRLYSFCDYLRRADLENADQQRNWAEGYLDALRQLLIIELDAVYDALEVFDDIYDSKEYIDEEA